MLSRLISSETHKPNLVINDACGRLLSHLYRPLKKQGYQIKVLNLMDCNNSIPYNPLAIIASDIKDGDISRASADCHSLAFSIYDPLNEGSNAFFYSMASSFFDAVVFSQFAMIRYDKIHHISNGLTNVTISSILNMVVQYGGDVIKSHGTGKPVMKLTAFFKNLEDYLSKLSQDTYADKLESNLLRVAISDFEECQIAGGKTAGSVYTTFLNGLRLYQQPSVAKVTSKNQVNFQSFGFDRLASLQYIPALGGYPVSIRIFVGHTLDLTKKPIEFYKTRSSASGLVKIPLTSKLKNYDRFYIRSTIHDDHRDISLTSTVQCDKHYYTPTDYLLIKHNSDNNPNDYLKRPLISDLELSNDHKLVIDKRNKNLVIRNVDTKLIKNNQNLIKRRHILYNPRPTALFCITPPNKINLNMIVESVIFQIFSALQHNQIKLQRPLDFIIDDSDALPKIHTLQRILSKSSTTKRINMIYVAQNIDWLKHVYGVAYTKQLLSSCAISEQISDGAIEPRVVLCSSFRVLLQAIHLVLLCHKHDTQSLSSIPVYKPQEYDTDFLSHINNEVKNTFSTSCGL